MKYSNTNTEEECTRNESDSSIREKFVQKESKLGSNPWKDIITTFHQGTDKFEMFRVSCKENKTQNMETVSYPMVKDVIMKVCIYNYDFDTFNNTLFSEIKLKQNFLNMGHFPFLISSFAVVDKVH